MKISNGHNEIECVPIWSVSYSLLVHLKFWWNTTERTKKKRLFWDLENKDAQHLILYFICAYICIYASNWLTATKIEFSSFCHFVLPWFILCILFFGQFFLRHHTSTHMHTSTHTQKKCSRNFHFNKIADWLEV